MAKKKIKQQMLSVIKITIAVILSLTSCERVKRDLIRILLFDIQALTHFIYPPRFV